MKVQKKKLEDMLLSEHLVTSDQVRECLQLHRTTGHSLPQLLVEKGYLSEENLVVTISEHSCENQNHRRRTHRLNLTPPTL